PYLSISIGNVKFADVGVHGASPPNIPPTINFEVANFLDDYVGNMNQLALVCTIKWWTSSIAGPIIEKFAVRAKQSYLLNKFLNL
ncbi:hypothetical protein TSUD_384870, partial [Trifolium subterraneum]